MLNFKLILNKKKIKNYTFITLTSSLIFVSSLAFQFILSLYLDKKIYGNYIFLLSISLFVTFIISGAINNFYLQNKNRSIHSEITNLIIYLKKKTFFFYIIFTSLILILK